MKKRLFAFVLTLCMVMTLLPSVALATGRDVSAAEEQAAALKTLGLFKGVSDTDFDLTRAPSRVEALVILIRNLGQESAATSGNWSHPFTDVPEWANSYVGYAYENGLTNGVSATEFGTADASATMFLTFTLRALGYSDTNGADFSWDNPVTLATQKGILPEGVDQTNFWRADAVLVSVAALSATLKDSSDTLADELISEGVFTRAAYEAAFAAEEPEWGEIVNPTVTDPTLTAPVDIKFGTHESEEWVNDKEVTVQNPALLWTSTNTEADCYNVRLYDEYDRLVCDVDYGLGGDTYNCYYELQWLLDSCLEDYTISTITITTLKSINNSYSSSSEGFPVGETAVFKCSCPVTVTQGEAVAVTDATVSEWSDEEMNITFAGTFEPFASVTLYCNYIVAEEWGESEGRWGSGGRVKGEGNLVMYIETEKYLQMLEPVGNPEISIVSDIVVENETTASGTVTIYPVNIQP